MAATLIGRKIGMTRIYTDDGRNVPVTVLSAGPCHVSQLKTPDRDGYAAVQLAFEDVKPRRSTMPVIGHDAHAGLSPQRVHREFRVQVDELESYELGQAVTVETLESVKYVDVIGTSKGKGTQGVVKRYGFKGQQATHGVERKHRSPGSIAAHSANAGGVGGPKKGKRMAGRMGNERVTVRNLDVMAIDKDKNLVLVKGPVPGSNQSLVLIRPSIRLHRRKTKLADS